MHNLDRTEHYSWDRYHQAVVALGTCLVVGLDPKPVGLIGIARGGLIAATILSHYLSLPLSGVLMVRSYENKKQSGVKISDHLPLLSHPIENYLFIDDLVDSGETMLAIRKLFPKARFAAPIGKVTGLNALQESIPIHPPRIIGDNIWVEFPWEVERL